MSCLVALVEAVALGTVVVFFWGVVTAWWTTRGAPRHYSEAYLARERDELERQAREDETAKPG
jgi:hypothetical protein